MKIGDKYLCLTTIKNILGDVLFKEGVVYEVLDFDDEEITLNHTLIANEYISQTRNLVEKNFIKVDLDSSEVKHLIKPNPNNYVLGGIVRDSYRHRGIVKHFPNDADLGLFIRSNF